MGKDRTPADTDRIDDLLLVWHQQRDGQGRDVPAAELCRDRPDLAAEAQRRIDVLRRFEGLLDPPSQVPPATVVVSGTPHDTRNGVGVPPASPATPEPPPTLPGYEIIAQVGEGGMGVVYKARHVKLNRLEAVKMVRFAEFATPQTLARFRFEAEAAAGLSHPNIVTVYGVGESAARPYLTMRWVDGQSLADRRPASPREAAALVARIARAVHHAHQHGILHRDLKPANILVDAAGEPFITDFGIARRLDGPTSVTRGIVGTPEYMPPEQARVDPNPTVASDVYGLGGVLYYCVTGRPPVTGANLLDVLKRVGDTPPVPPRSLNPAVDPDLEAVCVKCLEKNPADRYASAEELAEELERYLRGEGVTARAPGLLDWVWQLWQTRPEVSPHYTWQAPAWFGTLMVPTHLAVFAAVQAEASVSWVWLAYGICWSAMWVVLWWYMVRRFRRLLETERHSMMIAVGHLIAYIGLMLAYVPLSVSAPARTALPMFPALAAVSGLGLFVVGSTHWSRFFPLGLGMLALTPVLAWWPDAAPLLYGGAVAGCLWYWAYTKVFTFGARATPQTRSGAG